VRRRGGKARKTAAARRALETRSAGGVPLSVLIAHGASLPNTGAEAGRRIQPSVAEEAHAARILADPDEAAEELAGRRG
jgi:hypothetical protein